MSGLLVFEPPGSVTPDATGHWVALRPVQGDASVDDAAENTSMFPGVGSAALENGEAKSFLRLDSVRGPFWLTGSELEAFLKRYHVWRVVRHRRRAGVSNDLPLPDDSGVDNVGPGLI